MLDALLDVYPDARIVLTHRDPLKILPSVASILYSTMWVRSDAVDAERAAAAGSPARRACAARAARCALRESGRVDPRQFLDVRYADLVKRPDRDDRGDLRALRDRAHAPSAERRMRDYLARKPKGKHGEHRYEFGHTGFDLAAERERFRALPGALRRAVRGCNAPEDDAMPGDDDLAIGGRCGVRGEALKQLRRARRSPRRARERLASGRAWAEFCRSLEARRRAPARVPDAATRPSCAPRASATCSGSSRSGVDQSLQLADPDQPRFWRNPDSHREVGRRERRQPLPVGAHAPRRELPHHGPARRRLRLPDRGEGRLHAARRRPRASRRSSDERSRVRRRRQLRDPARRASAGGHAGNWLAIHPDARYVQIRQYFPDWERAEPAQLRDPADRQRGPAARRAHAARAWPSCSTRPASGSRPRRASGPSGSTQMRRAHDPERAQPAARFVGGADDIHYGNDWYRLGPDEALLIETEPPDARYWAFQLCDVVVPHDGLRDAPDQPEPPSGAHRRRRPLPLRDRAPRSGRARTGSTPAGIPRA